MASVVSDMRRKKLLCGLRELVVNTRGGLVMVLMGVTLSDDQYCFMATAVW